MHKFVNLSQNDNIMTIIYLNLILFKQANAHIMESLLYQSECIGNTNVAKYKCTNIIIILQTNKQTNK